MLIAAKTLIVLGICCIVLGTSIGAVSFASGRLRRILPVSSPFDLIHLGGYFALIGFACVVLGVAIN